MQRDVTGREDRALEQAPVRSFLGQAIMKCESVLLAAGGELFVKDVRIVGVDPIDSQLY